MVALQPSCRSLCQVRAFSTKNMGFPRPQETTYRYLTGDKRIAYDSWRPATANLSNTPSKQI